MFPDSLAERPGSYVGIVLSSELPAADRTTFKDLLAHLVDLRIQVSLYGKHVRYDMYDDRDKGEVYGVFFGSWRTEGVRVNHNLYNCTQFSVSDD